MSKMKVGLFVPCYINQLYPEVANANLKLLKKIGCEVVDFSIIQQRKIMSTHFWKLCQTWNI